MSRKGSGPSSENRRTEVVSVRLDPRLKYLAELAARKQRRPLSGFIEWAVEGELRNVILEEKHDSYGSRETISVTDAEATHQLWDVDEADRTVRLALHYPELLTYEEQMVWKLIRECGLLWRGTYNTPAGDFQWKVEKDKMRWDLLREHWAAFKKVAAGELPSSALPKWNERKPAPPAPSPKTASEGDLHPDEIPF